MTASLSHNRYFHTATKLNDDKVLVGGGWHNAALADCELFDPLTEKWITVRNLSQARNCIRLLCLTMVSC